VVSPDGVTPSQMVSVSASVNLPLHHKVQKFSSGTGSPKWFRKKGRKTVVVWYVVWQTACLDGGNSVGEFSETFFQLLLLPVGRRHLNLVSQLGNTFVNLRLVTSALQRTLNLLLPLPTVLPLLQHVCQPPPCHLATSNNTQSTHYTNYC